MDDSIHDFRFGDGVGRYDEACEAAAKLVGLPGAFAYGETGVLLIVVNGNRGSGFSTRITPHLLRAMPRILRDVADRIEGEDTERYIRDAEKRN